VLAADHEGKQVAEWLNSLGVSAFVLQYRLGERYRHPAPLRDAQRAIQTVRSRAKEWGVDPARVGVLGFSAGGHLASTAATHFDDGHADDADPVERQPSRPDFAVLCYAVISLADPVAHAGSRRLLLGDSADPALVEQLSNERQVTPRTPPTFLWHTADDASVPVENSILFFEALRKAGVPASCTSSRTAATASASPRRTRSCPSGRACARPGCGPWASSIGGSAAMRALATVLLALAAAAPASSLEAAVSGSGLPISDAVLQRRWSGSWIVCPGRPSATPACSASAASSTCRPSRPLRRPRERRPAVRPARQRAARRRRPRPRRHPLLAVRDVRPLSLPAAGTQPPRRHRVELRDAGPGRADQRPHGLRRPGRRGGEQAANTDTTWSALRSPATSRGRRA